MRMRRKEKENENGETNTKSKRESKNSKTQHTKMSLRAGEKKSKGETGAELRFFSLSRNQADDGSPRQKISAGRALPVWLPRVGFQSGLNSALPLGSNALRPTRNHFLERFKFPILASNVVHLGQGSQPRGGHGVLSGSWSNMKIMTLN